MEAKYVAYSEDSKEVVWLCKFLSGLEVILGMDRPITIYCDNTVAIANTKDSRHHRGVSILIGSIILLEVLWRVVMWQWLRSRQRTI